MISKNIDQIHRSTDGRFIITYGSDIEISRPQSATGSNSSESDDGGFLPRQTGKMRTSWRRPLVSYPSEMSFAPVTPTPRRASHDGLLRIGSGNEQQLLQIVPVELHPIPPTYQNIDSLDRSAMRHTLPYPHTPSRVSRIVSSSPAVSSPMAQHSSTILSPQTMYFSDLSSVLQASSRDRSFPTPQHSNISQLRLLQERYAQELPSLRAIHEETQRMAQYPHAQMLLHTPSQYLLPNSYYQSHHHINYGQQQPLVHQRPKSRLLPRHVRMARSAPELGLPHVSYIDTTMEASPESQSSSSGFGSRNTSHAQHNQSTRSGISTNSQQPNVRNLPPYRPPPQPLYYYYPYDASSTSQHSSPYTMDQWVDLIRHMSSDGQLASDNNRTKSVDVGSVDGHYEFDPATPTPTGSTPTGATRDDLLLSARDLVSPNSHFTLLQTQSLQPYQRKRVSKYENMEARVQAMKEEFYAYRKRQAMQMQQHPAATANKNSSVELESAC